MGIDRLKRRKLVPNLFLLCYAVSLGWMTAEIKPGALTGLDRGLDCALRGGGQRASRSLPEGVMFHHGIEDNHKLVHAGHEGNFFELTPL